MDNYRNLTALDAKYRYAHDLQERRCALCTDCHDCGFPELMGTPYEELEKSGCCGWLVDADPDRAIMALENLLGIKYEPDHDSTDAILAIARKNGLNNALDLMQEECAELVQAISKYRRYPKNRKANTEHILEEMADVSILLDQLAALLPCGEDRVARWRDEKVERTLDRMGVIVDMQDFDYDLCLRMFNWKPSDELLKRFGIKKEG